jgi:hypothetical protein
LPTRSIGTQQIHKKWLNQHQLSIAKCRRLSSATARCIWHETCSTAGRIDNSSRRAKLSIEIENAERGQFPLRRNRMSVSGISSSSLFNTQTVQNNFQQFQQDFQQLGQDLQSGNLSAAQSDFSTLQSLVSQNSTAASQSSSPIAQAFSQLAKDLQSGNLSAAQQDFTTIQKDIQSQSTQSQTASTGGHHHHHGGSGSSEISELLGQLGTALQSGDLSTAQQAYNSLAQQFQQSSPSNGVQTESTSATALSGVSIGVSISA